MTWRPPEEYSGLRQEYLTTVEMTISGAATVGAGAKIAIATFTEHFPGSAEIDYDGPWHWPSRGR